MVIYYYIKQDIMTSINNIKKKDMVNIITNMTKKINTLMTKLAEKGDLDLTKEELINI